MAFAMHPNDPLEIQNIPTHMESRENAIIDAAYMNRNATTLFQIEGLIRKGSVPTSLQTTHLEQTALELRNTCPGLKSCATVEEYSTVLSGYVVARDMQLSRIDALARKHEKQLRGMQWQVYLGSNISPREVENDETTYGVMCPDGYRQLVLAYGDNWLPMCTPTFIHRDWVWREAVSLGDVPDEEDVAKALKWMSKEEFDRLLAKRLSEEEVDALTWSPFGGSATIPVWSKLSPNWEVRLVVKGPCRGQLWVIAVEMTPTIVMPLVEAMKLKYVTFAGLSSEPDAPHTVLDFYEAHLNHLTEAGCLM